MEELDKILVRRRLSGGVMETLRMKNTAGTCMIDAVLNMVMNSNSSLKSLLRAYNFSQENESVKDFYDRLDKKSRNSANFGIFYELAKNNENKFEDLKIYYSYLVMAYAAIFTYINQHKAPTDEILNILKYHILYLENFKKFNAEDGRAYEVKLTKADSIANNAIRLDIGFLMYFKWIYAQEKRQQTLLIDKYIGATDKLLHHVYDVKHISGIYISYDYKLYKPAIQSVLKNAKRNKFNELYVIVSDNIIVDGKLIDEIDMDRFNHLYKAILEDYSSTGFICTDLTLFQYNVGFKCSTHAAYYNLLDESIQNGMRISYLPLSKLVFPRSCKDTKEYVRFISRNNYINIGFFDTDDMLGYYIPNILHFQKIDGKHYSTDFNKFSSKEGISHRYNILIENLKKCIPEMKKKSEDYIEKLIHVSSILQNYEKMDKDNFIKEINDLRKYDYSVLIHDVKVDLERIYAWIDKCSKDDELTEAAKQDTEEISMKEDMLIYFPFRKTYMINSRKE